MLYIVSTPIGNLEDITFRAINTLKSVDFIAAEDTRHSLKLFQKYDIHTPTISFHSHSKDRKLNKITDLLVEGKDIALISDAGTPGISDPGYVLIQESIKHQITIIPVPGATACISALTVSGLPIDKFIYLGFLPLKKGRQTLFNNLKTEEKSVVFYESPHRILKTLHQLSEFLGERDICIARELTKLHEEIFRGNLKSAINHFTTTPPRGEFVIVLGGKNVNLIVPS